MREVGRGLLAAAAALLAMALVAAVGSLLLGVDRSVTAAVVALAVGGSVDLQAASAGGLPVGLRGGLSGIPLGVSGAGAVVLGWLLLRRREGLLTRGTVAAVAFAGVMGGIAWWARGKLELPGEAGTPRGCGSARLPGAGAAGGLGAGFPAPAGRLGTAFPGHAGPPSPAGLEAAYSVAVGPTVAGASAFAISVLAACWLITRFPSAATTLRTLRWPLAGIAAVCLVAAGVLGGAAAAGAVLLLLPQLPPAAVLTGLGVPWHLGTTGLLSCAPDTSFPATRWVAAVVLLGCGTAVALRRRRPPLRQAAELAVVVGCVLGGTALLSRFSVDLSVSVFGFSVPVFGAHLAANPLLALAAGAAGGAVAGFAGSLLARAISVSSRAWTR
ncbi:streptophobe family protein [Amycolatopsis sp. NPDC003865]